MDISNIILIASIAVVTILVVLGFVIYALRSKPKHPKLDSSELIDLLGGSSNIKDYDVKQSRVTFEVVNPELVNTNGIKELGAKGVVEVENSIKVIAGSNATKLYEEIQKLHK